MNTAVAELLVAVAGALHFLQIPSMAYLGRRGLGLGVELVRLSPVNGQLVRVFVVAVMALLLGLGLSAVCYPEDWVGTNLGRFLTCLLFVFWVLRAIVQVRLFRVWPSGDGGRPIYFALLGLYAFLAFSYGAAFTSAYFESAA